MSRRDELYLTIIIVSLFVVAPAGCIGFACYDGHKKNEINTKYVEMERQKNLDRAKKTTFQTNQYIGEIEKIFTIQEGSNSIETSNNSGRALGVSAGLVVGGYSSSGTSSSASQNIISCNITIRLNEDIFYSEVKKYPSYKVCYFLKKGDKIQVIKNDVLYEGKIETSKYFWKYENLGGVLSNNIL